MKTIGDKPLLTMEELKVNFYTEHGILTAVDSVSYSIYPGEIVGIVGESGCGKSVMSQTILRLLEHTDSVRYSGKILYNGADILKLSASKLRELRGNDISMVSQDPLTSLNPVYTIGDQLDEALILHKKMHRKAARAKSVELLRLTGIPYPEQCAMQYPHELSGGMQQRVMIAMALSCEPQLLIADEPTTALDVTIQAQILSMLLHLNKTIGMAVLFITHDLGVVAEICDSVKVMYLGQIVEEAGCAQLFEKPLHPYTQGLLESIPQLEGERKEFLNVVEGVVPSLHDVPMGCRFSTRCQYADQKCYSEEPPMFWENDSHGVKCWHYQAIWKRRECIERTNPESK